MALRVETEILPKPKRSEAVADQKTPRKPELRSTEETVIQIPKKTQPQANKKIEDNFSSGGNNMFLILLQKIEEGNKKLQENLIDSMGESIRNAKRSLMESIDSTVTKAIAELNKKTGGEEEVSQEHPLEENQTSDIENVQGQENECLESEQEPNEVSEVDEPILAEPSLGENRKIKEEYIGPLASVELSRTEKTSPKVEGITEAQQENETSTLDLESENLSIKEISEKEEGIKESQKETLKGFVLGSIKIREFFFQVDKQTHEILEIKEEYIGPPASVELSITQKTSPKVEDEPAKI